MRMSRNPFDPTLDALPRQLPVFPLAGVLLLPRSRLPLNVFEPRYLRMTVDTLGSDRMIGMIQPVDPDCPSPEPGIHATGCAGRIVSFSETEDGRFLLTLLGVCRFRVAREMEPRGGYRVVEPDWTPFAGDLFECGEAAIDRARLLAGLRCYFRHHGLTADWEHVESSPDEKLINALAMICPFSPGEKQAMLESRDLTQRAKLLIGFVEMSIFGACGDEGHRH